MANNIKNLMSGEEFLKNQMEATVVDYNNPSCKNCNDCCSLGTMMTEEEYIKIKKYLSKDKQGRAAFTQALNVLRKYKGTGIVYLMCPFSNKSKKCSIYSMRPEICREFHCTPSLQGPNYGKDKYGTNPRTIGDFFKGRV